MSSNTSRICSKSFWPQSAIKPQRMSTNFILTGIRKESFYAKIIQTKSYEQWESLKLWLYCSRNWNKEDTRWWCVYAATMLRFKTQRQREQLPGAIGFLPNQSKCMTIFTQKTNEASGGIAQEYGHALNQIGEWWLYGKLSFGEDTSKLMCLCAKQKRILIKHWSKIGGWRQQDNNSYHLEAHQKIRNHLRFMSILPTFGGWEVLFRWRSMRAPRSKSLPPSDPSLISTWQKRRTRVPLLVLNRGEKSRTEKGRERRQMVLNAILGLTKLPVDYKPECSSVKAHLKS